MLNVGIVGHGYSAKIFHIPLLNQARLFKLVGVSTSRPLDVQRDNPSLETFTTAGQLIESSNIDVVIITAPNDAHFTLAKHCLEKGKHVVVEKPMTTTVDEAQALSQLAKNRDLSLSVFHNRRWDGDFLTVRQLITQGRLGEIRYFESHFDRYRPTVKSRWKEDGGPGSGTWFDLGAHLLDQSIMLFGMPSALSAQCLNMRENAKTTDYFHVILHYPQCEVVLHSSSLFAAPNPRFRIEGTRATYIKYGLDPQESQLQRQLPPSDSAFGVEQKSQYGTLYSAENAELIATLAGRYSEYYTQLADAILHGAPNPVTSEEASQVISLLEAAEISSHSGQRHHIR